MWLCGDWPPIGPCSACLEDGRRLRVPDIDGLKLEVGANIKRIAAGGRAICFGPRVSLWQFLNDDAASHGLHKLCQAVDLRVTGWGSVPHNHITVSGPVSPWFALLQ